MHVHDPQRDPGRPAGRAPRTERVDAALAALRSPRPRAARPSTLRRAAAVVAGALALAAAGGAALPGASGAASSAQPGRNQVTALGAASDRGPRAPIDADAPLVAIAASPSGRGYWLAAADGGVFAYGDAGYHGGLGNVALAEPVVGVAATPSGDGYWLVAADGGVFAFGDAEFYGSTGAIPLAEPVVGIAATATGAGYWLAAADGGVFAFGDADYAGSAAEHQVSEPIVGIAAAPRTDGYLLAGSRGGVYAFGGADFVGTGHALFASSVTAITGDPDGRGYWLLRRNGAVTAIGARYFGDAGWVDLNTAAVPNVGIATRPAGDGYWIAQGDVPPPPRATVDHNHPFLVCTRAHESDNSGGYRAVSSSGRYRGAYQFSQSTWNSTARSAGRLDLVGVDPAAAGVEDQDALALHLYSTQGASPWLGRCAGL